MKPKLDISILNTYNSKVLTVADVSYYPVGYIINNPYLEITVPGFPKLTTLFTPKGVNVFNSDTLQITDGCPRSLPDGIYKVRFSIHPNYELFVERSFLRLDAVLEKFDAYYLTLNLMRLDTQTSTDLMKQLDIIEVYLQGAMSAANKCDEKLAYELLNKANSNLDKIKCYVPMHSM